MVSRKHTGQIETRRRWPVSFPAPASPWIMLTVERVADRADRGRGTDLVEPVGVGDGDVLAVAFAYYQLSWLLYVLRPAWSYALNADFEDHAEHEYALFVEEHPELDDQPYDGHFAEEYGRFASLSDLFRQIGHDERVHKHESLARMGDPRFR